MPLEQAFSAATKQGWGNRKSWLCFLLLHIQPKPVNGGATMMDSAWNLHRLSHRVVMACGERRCVCDRDNCPDSDTYFQRNWWNTGQQRSWVKSTTFVRIGTCISCRFPPWYIAEIEHVKSCLPLVGGAFTCLHFSNTSQTEAISTSCSSSKHAHMKRIARTLLDQRSAAKWRIGFQDARYLTEE